MTRSRKPATFAFVLFATLAVSAAADSLLIGDRRVQLEPPAASCVYDPKQPADAHMLAFLEKANKSFNHLVLAFADCRDMDAMRRGETGGKGDYGQILAPISGNPDEARADLVSETTEYYRTHVNAVQEGIRSANDLLKADTRSPLLKGARALGILKAEPDFVQIGVLQSFESGGKSQPPVVSVLTITKLGAPVNINLYHLYVDDMTLRDLQAHAETYVRRLIALNPDAALTRQEMHDKAMSHVAGWILGVTLVAGALFWVRKKQVRS